MNSIVVLGAGESGTGAALLAKHLQMEVWLSDAGTVATRYAEILTQAGIAWEQGGHSEERILAASLVVKSPGVPEKAPIVQKIRAAGIPLISEIEFASHYTKARIIGITGTNGKTTTTLLTHHLLQTAGIDAVLAGNIGDSFAAAVASGRQPDWYVLEISSFQLDDIEYFRPDIAILLNITPDHLDRYQYQMGYYADAKMKLLKNSRPTDLFIYNADDSGIADAMQRHHTEARFLPVHSSSFGEDSIAVPHTEQPDTKLVFNNLPLKGKHNQLNMSAAVMAALAAGASAGQVANGLQSFVNAPHRMQKIREWKGLVFINDSKATNVDAATYALASFSQPVIWIAGGTDKGNDYSLMEKVVSKHVKGLVCMGVDNSKLLGFFKNKLQHLADTNSMEAALEAAIAMASAGDVILLSPACASFDLFKNYEDRGNQFKETVMRLG
jgi:UDP-N-acetylmuramoylalanine--D-glutamate ligase